MVPWRPNLSTSGSVPAYQHLADAIATDINSGHLPPGTRLPPQRELAHALAISVGVVTRAYDEATRRGLVRAHVGRGTFVAEARQDDGASGGEIDLSKNIAPAGATAGLLAETLGTLRRLANWSERLAYLPTGGLEADRRAASGWLERTAGLERCDWRTLICCAGAQNAMAIAAAATCRAGDTILCEATTFSGMKALAAVQDYRLHGVEMDAEGVRPDALDRAAAETGARVFYTLPTLHNPTARTASLTRRRAIVEVARVRDLQIIEDDVYALYARDLSVPPLATLAPERTFYLSSLSKTLTPGLRQGFLVAPDGDPLERCFNTMRALMNSPSGVGAGIATRWFESGLADELARNVGKEMRTRTEMALTSLKGLVEPPTSSGTLHLWLPMSDIEAERVARRALRGGLRLTSPEAYQTAGARGETGLRLCIGAATSQASLARALVSLKDVIAGDHDDLGRDQL